MNSRVCSAHFENGRRTGKKDVPSVFPWTSRSSRKPPACRWPAAEVNAQRQGVPEEGSGDLGDREETEPMEHTQPVEDSSSQPEDSRPMEDTQTMEDSSSQPKGLPPMEDTQTMEDSQHAHANDSERAISRGLLCDSMEAHAKTKAELRETQEKLVAALDRVAELEAALKQAQGCATDRRPQRHFSLRQIEDSDELVRFYTGLPSMAMFNVLYSFVDCVPGLVMWD